MRTVRIVAAISAVLLAAACGGTDTTSGGGDASAGPPQSGGAITLLQVSEPRSLDPAVLSNGFSTNGALGNALYGALITNDPKTGALAYGLAQSLTSADGGKTWVLKLRAGLKFSDGSAFDAAAVKYNWDRIKDPKLGSQSLSTAAYIDATEATDTQTLTFTLRAPVANFGQGIATTSLTWIASPAALQAGQQAFDAKPIGAGPFTLTSWTRQDKIVVARNASYFDAPKPYLNSITFRTNGDENQRLATLTTGGGDLMISINPQYADKAEASGLGVARQAISGGNVLLFNMAQAPFDDQRARAAVTKAIDLNAVNAAVYSGKGIVPNTLFDSASPFYSDIKLTGYDKTGAQTLFDELAKAGKPLSFTMYSYPTSESKAVVQAIQAQLSAYKNVTAKVEVLDFAGAAAKFAQKQYQAIISGITFLDPEITLWQNLRTGSPGNYVGISDPQLDTALDAGRAETDVAKRKDAYADAQTRIAGLNPFITYVRSAPAIVTSKKVHGVALYGVGSLLVDGLWVK
ncbi:ABC transporter substrate-binding protein [Dactylosporangium sp. NPDC005572]|uniref:ABC transporter substrate-binding protein n=1 Tax=Dactylosporangium sp. NPDC005572 TaxID=3156889 RepID=UPI0033B16E83